MNLDNTEEKNTYILESNLYIEISEGWGLNTDIGAAGFEPANHGIKTRCLTAWLRPIMVASIAQSGMISNLSDRQSA